MSSIVDNESEDDEENVPTRGTSLGFTSLLAEEEDAEAGEVEGVEGSRESKAKQGHCVAKRKKKSKGKKKKNAAPDAEHDDKADEELLAAAMERAASLRLSSGGGAMGTVPLYLRFDQSRVDAEREVAARLGTLRSGRRPHLDSKRRRGVFPESFDGDFGEAPSFAKGGVRYDGTKVIVSDDWAEGVRELDACLGDPNELAKLCAMRPFHAPTLVVTAEAVARLEAIDLAWPLCCRALRAFTMGEGTRQKVCDGRFRVQYDGASRPLFDASFVAGRLAGMRGAQETRANLMRFCLSLDVTGDPKGVVMRLSADLFDAGDVEACLAMFEQPPAEAAWWPLVPTICITRALVHLVRKEREKATDALADALAKFPHLLLCLLDACNIRTDQSSFRDVVWHEHFSKPNWTTNQRAAYAAGGLPRALDVACLRTRKVMSDNVDLLLAAAKQVAAQQCATYRPLVERVDKLWASQNARPASYAHLPITEFTDKFEYLGAEAAQGFDASLLTPQAARQYTHLRYTQRRLGSGVAAAFPDDSGDNLINDILAQLPPDLQAHFQAQAQAGVSPQEIEAALIEYLA